MKRPWLAPLLPLYAAGLALRDLRLRRGWEPVRKLAYPVLSIGNLSAGGAGKTPLAIALAQLLAHRGFHIDILSRGYGRTSAQPMRVDPEGTAQLFGDEPLLMARAGIPVYVAPQRYDAGLLAEADAEMDAAGHHEIPTGQRRAVHVLDDGFQHRQLDRDLDILLLNRDDWQDTLLPAGNLREPLRGAARADVIAIPAEDPSLEANLRASGLTCPIWRIRRRMDIPAIDGPVAAFCGIARPGQFFAGLEAQGSKLVLRRAFSDHHRYSAAELEALAREARDGGATALLTTEKDAVRMGKPSQSLHGIPLLMARLQVQIEDESSVATWLAQRLLSGSSSQSV